MPDILNLTGEEPTAELLAKNAPIINKSYKDERQMLIEVCKRAKIISMGSCGIYTENMRIYWSSVLFSRLVVTADSVVRLAPRVDPPEHNAPWDFSALGSIVRNLAECYFVFFYLCVDHNKNEDEWLTRQNLIQLRDNKTRWKMFSDWHPDDPHAGFSGHHDDLTTRLKSRTYFNSLPEKVQRELLKGDKDPFTQDEILEKMGENKSLFRGYYRFLCSHTHTGPISFYRMAEHGRGKGVENTLDKALMASAMEMACNFLARATEDMLVFFPDAESRGATIGGNRKARRQNRR